MRSARRLAHEKTPGAAELGVHVAVGFDPVLDQRANKRVDAVARAASGGGALRNHGNKTGAIDEKLHIREAFGHHANVATLTVLVGFAPERHPFLQADYFGAYAA